jgi:hypothetical protein
MTASMASFLKLTLVGDGGVGSKNVLFLLLLLRREIIYITLKTCDHNFIVNLYLFFKQKQNVQILITTKLQSNQKGTESELNGKIFLFSSGLLLFCSR